MERVAAHRVPVIEDDAYVEVRVDESPAPPSLRAFDRHGLVVCLGTFSKVLSPGVRVGWVAAQRAWLERYVILKQSADLHTSSLDQMLVMRWLESGGFDANLQRIRTVYRERRDVMLAALATELPPGARFGKPAGGLFVWLELPAGIRARDLLVRCLAHQVAFVPGDSFFPNGGRHDTARLNFSNMPPDRIREGIARLGVAMREALDEVKATASV
jgi:DNA-binding transcriptional MocR family regulator